MKMKIKACLGAALLACFSTGVMADVRIDVKNDSGEDCSVALHARADKTKWITQGWYVFMSGEEAPIILDSVNDIHNVYLYHDCGMKFDPEDETKKAYVKINLRFSDDLPKSDDKDYEEVTFVRLNTAKYTITGPASSK